MTARPRLHVSMMLVVAASGLAIAIAGCANKPEPSEPKVSRDPNRLVIYGGCALKPVLEAAQAAFTAQNTGKSADLTFDQPTKLAKRIKGGAVPDIVVFPGTVELGELEGEGLLDGSSRQTFGGMKAVIMVPAGNPAGVHEPNDLLSSKVKTIAIPAPGLTSVGTDAKRELQRIGLWTRLQDKLSFRVTAQEALEALSKRSVDAAVLYDPCLRLAVKSDIAASSVERVSTLTQESEPGARICVELHRQSPNSLLAARFLRVLVEQQGAAATRSASPSPEGRTAPR